MPEQMGGEAGCGAVLTLVTVTEAPPTLRGIDRRSSSPAGGRCRWSASGSAARALARRPPGSPGGRGSLWPPKLVGHRWWDGRSVCGDDGAHHFTEDADGVHSDLKRQTRRWESLSTLGHANQPSLSGAGGRGGRILVPHRCRSLQIQPSAASRSIARSRRSVRWKSISRPPSQPPRPG